MENRTLLQHTDDLEHIFMAIAEHEASGEEVPQELTDRLSEVVTAQAEKIDRCAAFVGRAESNIQWLRDEKKKIDSAIKRMQWAIDHMKYLAGEVMDQSETRKLDGLRGHYFSKRRVTRVKVVNEEKIPDEYKETKKVVQKDLIKRALTNGKDVPGAVLEYYDTVTTK